MEVWWAAGELELLHHALALQQVAGQHCSWALLLVLPLLTAALPQSCQVAVCSSHCVFIKQYCTPPCMCTLSKGTGMACNASPCWCCCALPAMVLRALHECSVPPGVPACVLLH
jgi:hypothetical protein